MEAAKASLMAVGQLSIETVEERLMEARRTYKLNLGCVLGARKDIGYAVSVGWESNSVLPCILQLCWDHHIAPRICGDGQEVQPAHYRA